MALILMPMSFVACSDDDDDDVDDSVSIADDGYEVSGTINGHYYVDLGLSVKWADRNIGASSSSAYGDYFAWGETETKDSYTTSNSVTYGVDMDDFSGNVEYDAATANWGSSWRMPTYVEMEELVEDCTWTWTTQNDVNGYLVTGSTGNSIFLPAAGHRVGKSLKNAGSSGYYWSSTPYGSSADSAYELYLGSSSHHVSDGYRYCGYTVRPVSDY